MSVCVPLPTASIPTLPAPLSIALAPPELPDFTFTFCCKLPPIQLPIPPVPIPPLIFNPAVMATLNAFIAQLNTYLNALPLKCPVE